MVSLTCTHCHGPLPPRRSRGPAPSYCSARCRQAAYLARRRAQADLELVGIEAPPLTVPFQWPADTDSQVAQAIIEGRSIAGAFMRLGREARVEFAWRCAKTGEAMRVAIDRYFPEVR
jgi:hypothetical protein